MPAANTTLIPAHAYHRVRWRNDAGWKRDIASSVSPDAGTTADWVWRLSIAEIEHDGPFSTFPGVERECMVLRGEGVQLQERSGGHHRLQAPFGRHRFSGESSVVAQLVDGRVEVLNLMWQRDRIIVETWRRPLVGTMMVFVEPGDCWLVHVLAGSTHIDSDGVAGALSAGDTACLRTGAGRARHMLDGGGELWLARLTPAGR